MRRNVLIVSPDAGLRGTIEECLRPFGLLIRMLPAGDRESVTQRLAEQRVDLAVLDLDEPTLEGFAVAGLLVRSHPELPILALVRAGSPHPFRNGGDRRLRMVAKPVDPAQLPEIVLDMLPSAPHGRLTGVTAAGLMQLLALEAWSGVLVLDSPAGTGRLVIERGELIDADAHGERGEEAVYRIVEALSRPETEILIEQIAAPVERTIHRPLDGVLLDAVRRHDESLRAGPRGGAVS